MRYTFLKRIRPFALMNESRRPVTPLSLDAALRYIENEMQEENREDDSECRTIPEKWGPGENGEWAREAGLNRCTDPLLTSF